jgi:hypothetical protein
MKLINIILKGDLLMKNLAEVFKSKKVIKRVLIAGGTLVGLAIVGAILKPSDNTDDNNESENESAESAEVTTEE